MGGSLDRLEGALVGALAGLDETSMARRRGAGKWSVHEIAEHLLLTYAETERNFAARLAKGSATRARPSFGQSLGRLVVLTVGYFPTGRKAPETVVPRVEGSVGGEALGAEARVRIGAMEELLRAAETAFGEHVRSVTHPILGPLTPEEWRRFHLWHGLHHVRQIRRTIAAS